MSRSILLTGASGYVGGRLAPVLLERGHRVRALLRNPDASRPVAGAETVKGDALTGEGLHEALASAEVAYYLIHSMGGGAGGDFTARERGAARTFARAARDAGVGRVIYLGGLPSSNDQGSQHLSSRHETAEILTDVLGPERVVYARAAMVMGAGSASFDIVANLVERLPLMITPRWIDTPSQPIAVRDVVAALAALGERDDVTGEVQLGGADVLTYREMLLQYAKIRGRRAPLLVRTPVLSPTLSSYWVALVGGVDPGVSRPLVEGLSSETVVMRPPPPGINDHPMGFDDAVREALAP